MTAVKHVVGLSGGKDSTAMALYLVENQPREYEFICNKTGNELPAMVDHWAKLEGLLGASIRPVTYKTDLLGTIEELQMLPNFRARWCTRILKIEPTLDYFAGLPAGSVLYVGLRADEPERKGLYGEELNVRFPLRELGWTERDVWAYLASRNVAIPKRTDCALCPYQRLKQWRDLYYEHPQLFWEGVSVELQHGHTFRSAGRDTWPAALADLAQEFERGRPLRKSKKDDAKTCRVCSL